MMVGGLKHPKQQLRGLVVVGAGDSEMAELNRKVLKIQALLGNGSE